MDELKLVWWNTALSPAASTEPSEDEYAFVCRTIEYFIKDQCADFIALCEINDDAYDYICSVCKFDGYRFVSGVNKVGQTNFDLMYIINVSKVDDFAFENVVYVKNNRTKKIAQKIAIKVCGFEVPLVIFASHWPSKIRGGENGNDRYEYAMNLQVEAHDVFKNSKDGTPYVILMGDYNDDPFSACIFDGLMATRDRELVLKRDELLYNPYWRIMSDLPHYERVMGSYYYKSGALTRWHVFDQVIFSKAFLQNGDWIYCDGSTLIMDIPAMTDVVLSSKHKFDHMPLSVRIKRDM
ncbi:hypothetical protein [Oceanobacter mangrovi]|uniref:endonuclease/exonuclease/phosphatase family protein n=1 Tax=Oceanobacter mangrovi TaxID=2862510 RepID=UPI001C8DE03F|nr:hypothetical protein [Oceanobacter mangrovi]